MELRLRRRRLRRWPLPFPLPFVACFLRVLGALVIRELGDVSVEMRFFILRVDVLHEEGYFVVK